MAATFEYRSAPRIHVLGANFYDPVEPATFPQTTLRYRNNRWAARVGLAALDDARWERSFARFEPLPDNLPQPLALRYHGHQFQTYNPALGDGRGFLFAQLIDDAGRLLDLATKGSGVTPWSRGGDGRLTLKGGVREVLATSMLEARGVYTSKSFSLYETGEELTRSDEPSPTRSSVLVRLGHSHIRFGTFQRHAYHRDRASLEALLRYCVAEYAPELCHIDDCSAAASMFMTLVVKRSAILCAQWMAAGFVHGVLNTDNMNVTGESFDYGPYRFLPTLDPSFTAAYFDHSGLYAYGRQPEAVHWNLGRLAEALEPLCSDGSLMKAVGAFPSRFERALDNSVRRRLGVRRLGTLQDRLLRIGVFEFLRRSRVGFEQFFFDWYGGECAETRARQGPSGEHYIGLNWSLLGNQLRQYQPLRDDGSDMSFLDAADSPCDLLIEEIEDIWAAISRHDDWTLFTKKLAQIDETRAALTPPL